jgi:hypothetical protein
MALLAQGVGKLPWVSRRNLNSYTLVAGGSGRGLGLVK